MAFVVPFDGSDLAEAALTRAVEYARVLDEDVVAVTVVPERKRYGRKKGWIDPGQSYDPDEIIESLREQIQELAPDASFDYERIREFPPEAELAGHIERLAMEHDPSVLFLGSDNVGRVVTPLTSVGVRVAAEGVYDVFVVRRADPPNIDAIEPHEEFYEDESS